MSAAAALRARLADHAPITALVGDRIYPQAAPASATYPCLVYALIGRDVERAMGADARPVRARFQVSAWAASHAEADAVAAAVRGALQRWRGVAAGVTVQDCYLVAALDGYDAVGRLHQAAQDIELIVEE